MPIMQVTPLRARGRVLSRSELPPPTTGSLLIDDFIPAQGFGGRRRLQARLTGHTYGVGEVNLIQPIFDVQLLKADAEGLYLQGAERDTDDTSRALMEHVQVWLCRPVVPGVHPDDSNPSA